MLPIIAGLIILVVIAGIFLKRRRAQSVRTQTVKLVEKTQVSHDTYLFTFLLQNQQQPLGLKVGEHIQLQAAIEGQNGKTQVVERKYTPVSTIDKKGSFDLLIKIYNKCQRFPEGGKMTQWLDQRNVGENLTIRLPFGRFNYLGNATIRIRNFGDLPPMVKKVDYLYMVAGGTGITPIYQVIQYITNAKEEVSMRLLYLNRTEDDILLQQELTAFQNSNPNLKVFYSVDHVTKPGWNGYSGFINKDKVQETIGRVTPGTMCLSCGPPVLSNLVEGIWRELGVANQLIYRF